MPSPVYNNIKGTTAGTPGTGSFTPNAAASGARAWSNVPAGWMGMVRFEDGSSWELRYCYWNGTAISRPANGFVDSSSGSGLTLTSSATAAMVVDANEVMSHVGGIPWRIWSPQPNSTTADSFGMPARVATGTAAQAAIASTNLRTEQPRVRFNTATTANAQAGWSSLTAIGIYSTTAGRGGVECVCRFGAAQLPTGPRLLAGLSSVTIVANTGEPSALVASIAAFAKDSTDTNIQLLTNDNSGGGAKVDTGIPWAVDGWYEASVWVEPGGGRVSGLLLRLDTGDIWYGSTTTQLPANGATFLPMLIGGLSGTTGTALQFEIGSYCIRGGA